MNSLVNKKLELIKNFILNVFKIFKLIWQSSRLVMFILLLISILEGLILPLNIIISKYFIDSTTNALVNKNSAAFRQVLIWFLIQALAAVATQILSQANTYFYQRQLGLFNIHISKLLIEKTNELDVSYFENSEFYDSIEKVNSESAGRSLEMLDIVTRIIKEGSALLGSSVIIFRMNPIIFILSVITTIPMFFVNLKLSEKKYNIFSDRVHEARYARFLQRTMMHFNNIKEIKLYRLGNYYKNVILSIYNKHLEQDCSIGKKQLKQMTFMEILDNLVSYLFKLYVLFITIQNSLTIGTMTMYISALSNIDQSIRSILGGAASLYTNNLYINNFFSVMNLKSKIIDKKEAKEFDNSIHESIEFRNVSFKYPGTDKFVLKNVNLIIKAKEVCAIVGLNGSGKTTLIKLLARLYDPTEGGIYIDGRNIKEYKLESLYKCISIVFQDYVKFPFSVMDNIGFGNIDKLKDFERIELSAKKSKASEFISKMDKKYETILDKQWLGGLDISLGQWQKLAISRAFMSDASIMILDEPTASLDAEAEYNMFQNFKELIGECTCVLISHRFSTVKMANNIYVMENGSIVEAGSHNHLMNTNGLYARLFNMQAEAYISDENNIA